MRDRQPEFYCISACTGDRSTEVLLNHKLGERLDELDLPHKQASGRYEGETELTYVVVTDKRASVLALAQEFEQESVLYVDGYREAWLIYTGGSKQPTHLGSWHKVGKQQPSGDYTYSLGIYYEVIR